MHSAYIDFDGKGNIVPVAGKGTIEIKCHLMDSTQTVALPDALHGPEGRVNLISIPQLAAKSAGILFKGGMGAVSVQGPDVIHA